MHYESYDFNKHTKIQSLSIRCIATLHSHPYGRWDAW